MVEMCPKRLHFVGGDDALFANDIGQAHEASRKGGGFEACAKELRIVRLEPMVGRAVERARPGGLRRDALREGIEVSIEALAVVALVEHQHPDQTPRRDVETGPLTASFDRMSVEPRVKDR